MIEHSSLLSSYDGIAAWDTAKARGATIAVDGCGALGSYAAEALALMGVGQIVLIDDDLLAPHNIPRTAGVTVDDIGRPKVQAVADAIRRRVGDLAHVVPIHGSVQTAFGAGIARRSSAVLLCADNREARRFGCRRARSAGKPHLSGAIDGWQGLVAGPFDPPRSACYECGLTERERQDLMNVEFSCSAPPVDGRAPSVPTTPIAAQMTTAWMVHSILAYLQGGADHLLGKRVFIDPAVPATRVASYEPRLDCTCADETQVAEPVMMECSGSEITPAGLISEARSQCGDDASVLLEYRLVTEESCQKCGRMRKLDIPRHEAAPSECDACGGTMAGVRWTNAIDESSPLAGLTLRQLGLPWLHYVTVAGGTGTATYELSGDADEIGLLEMGRRC